MNNFQVALYCRDAEERARQELQVKLDQVNLFLQVGNLWGCKLRDVLEENLCGLFLRSKLNEMTRWAHLKPMMLFLSPRLHPKKSWNRRKPAERPTCASSWSRGLLSWRVNWGGPVTPIAPHARSWRDTKSSTQTSYSSTNLWMTN